MSKLRRILFLALSVAAPAVMLALLLTRPVNNWRGWRRLPDGSRMRILAAPYGQTNYSATGLQQKWRVLVRLMPKQFTDKLGINESNLGYSDGLTNELRVITLREGQQQGMPGPFTLAVLGGHGQIFEAFPVKGDSVNPAELEVLWQIMVFPRRERFIRLALVSRQAAGGWTNDAEFKIPNPVRGPFPAWQPEALPTTKQNGDLSVTLTSLTTGFSATEMTNSKVREMITATHAVFLSGSSNWHFRGLELADATGNVWKSPGWTSNFFVARKGPEEQVTFRGGLGLDEPAWKVRAEFSRESGFGAGELVEIGSIPVPTAGTRAVLSLSTNFQGTTLTLNAIRARNSRPGGFLYPATNHENLIVTLPQNSVGVRVALVKAVDEQQREIKTGVDLDDDNYLVFALDIPPEAKQLRLTFALHKSRFVEFLAKPTPASR